MSTTAPGFLRAWSRYLPTPRAWLAISAAFCLGLLLFVLVWLDKRGDAPARDAGIDDRPQASGELVALLPAPLPGGGHTASGMDGSAPARPTRIDAHVQVPAMEQSPTTGTAGDDSPAPPSSDGPVATTTASQPRILSSQPPDYPRAALRKGIGGEVLLRIEVGANGRPTSVEIEHGSGERSLDRAAVNAAKRWRFEPAMQDGRPVASTYRQTISFTPPR